ncbi:hypothetical protein [Mesomycoplasma ovipneumoniae]|uniref:hypothetical protein n=1 Tax=Mesomycoplasma ovipneumoniae TaxID=29562 RepID=UPI0028AD06FF|nr:hypothetical protein [Mesomycoplasma ovipneumoniae]MDW2922162.1 hypothetical protein [Mesomycoplasma ovipneumoniae]WNM14810.1 hypothetical protein RNM01_03640 [Mesomycoplasma ovipneumoniae]
MSVAFSKEQNSGQKKCTINERFVFNFRILSYSFRKLEISVEGVSKTIDYNSEYFFSFVENLIFFLSKNKYALRWDYEKITLFNLENLQLAENLDDFKSKFKLITTFDLEHN